MKNLFRFVSENLLTVATCAFVAGIAVSFHFAGSLPLQIVFLILTGIITLLCLRWSRTNLAVGMVVLFFAGLGVHFGSDCCAPPADPTHIFHVVGAKREAVVVGTVDSLQGYDGRLSRAEIDCAFIRFKDTADFVPVTGRVSLGLKGVWPKEILPGERIAVRTDLTHPRSLKTAGSFDYVRFLAEKGIWVTGMVESPLLLRKVVSPPSLLHDLRYRAERDRVRIGDFFAATLSPELAGIYKAVIIGEWTGIPPEVIEQFKGAGCVHILSISGAHMSILWLFLFSVLYWLLRRSEWLILHADVKRTAALACLVPLCFYALLAGAGMPVLRSLIMSAVVIFALWVHRRKSIFTSLSLALLCLLVWRPANVLNVSFQLTFAAVASIAAIVPLLSRLFRPPAESDPPASTLSARLWRWLLAALAVSVAVTVGTAPLLLFWFNRISLIGPLANLAVEPLICFWSLPLGFLAVPAIFYFPALASMLVHAGSWGLVASIWLVTLFNSLPLASVWLATPSPYLVACFYGALIVLLAVKENGRLRRTALIVLATAIGLFIRPPAEALKFFRRDSTVTVLDVGQGSAALLELPFGKRVLIDGGGPASPRFNTGEKVVAPFLWKKGITSLDAVIITHADADHYNGLPFILEHFRPQTLWTNGSAGHEREYADLLDRAEKLEVSTRVPGGNEALLQAGGAQVASLENPIRAAGKETDSADPGNDGGLILRFTDRRFSALFPGDISKKLEDLLARGSDNLAAQVLLAPHHGSSTSNSAAFLEAVHPDFLIVSAGYTYDGIFPARGLQERASAYGIKMMTTARDGCVVITIDDDGYSVAVGDGLPGKRAR